MAPFVEMLPTNFFPDEPPSPDPELDPEPELEPDDAPDADPELASDPEPDEPPLDEEPDPELAPPPEPEVEPEEAPDAEPEDEAVVDDPLSGFEPELVPLPPPSSPDHWFEPPEEPHAIRTDATAAGSRRREREARFINSAVAARSETRQRIGGQPARQGESARSRDGFLVPPPLLGEVIVGAGTPRVSLKRHPASATEFRHSTRSARFALRTVVGTATAAAWLFSTAPARAASLSGPITGWASGVPGYVSMYEYVPVRLATNPPILVVSHYCGGTASGVFGEAQGGGIVAAADQYGFVMILPQTSNNCWDVGSTASLTHNGGGDTQAIAEMVTYAITKHGADANRVYATGTSSGAMMTEALLAVYPDVFKAGAEFSGVPAGCWAVNYSASGQWSGPCAGGQVTHTPQQWATIVQAMDPGYSGLRPRIQLWHGEADTTINYNNQTEGIKEWSDVLGLSTTPTSMATVTFNNHSWNHQSWQNSCGFAVLDAWSEVNGPHGTDANLNATYVIPFLGLDKTGPTDPEVAQCGDAGPNGSSSSSSSGGSTSSGSSASGSSGGAANSSSGNGGASTSSGGGGRDGTVAGSASGSNGGTDASGSPGDDASGGLVENDSGGGLKPSPSSGCSCRQSDGSVPEDACAIAALAALSAAWSRRREKKRVVASQNDTDR